MNFSKRFGWENWLDLLLMLELGDNKANHKIVFQTEWVNMSAEDTVHVTPVLREGDFVYPLNQDTWQK